MIKYFKVVIFERSEMNENELPAVVDVSRERLRSGMLLQTVTFILLTVILLAIILAQRLYYKKRLSKRIAVPNSQSYYQQW